MPQREPAGSIDASISDSDDGDDIPCELEASPSAMRQKQNAIFHNWCMNDAATQIRARAKTVKPESDEQLSVQRLLAQQEKTAIIKDPREYQLELFERAKTKNTIAVLDTGSGKTLIAVLLLRHLVDKELERRAAGGHAKVAFFLVPSVSLVFQQYAVLERNLGHKVTRLYGAMGVDSWDIKYWTELLDDAKIIICTADILLHSLAHAFVCMTQINLLVFDEAHHAKAGHAYSRIMADFYYHCEKDHRPRVFGMTASPVNANVDIVGAARQLENLLDSRIATTTNVALMQRAIQRPKELVVNFAATQWVPITPLYHQLHDSLAQLPVFVPLFKQAEQLRLHLVSRKKTERAMEKARAGDENRARAAERDQAYLEEGLCLVEAYPFGEPVSGRPHLSDKVQVLRRYLALHFSRQTETRCLVFVEQRITARLLAVLFEQIGGPHLRPSCLIGAGSNTFGDLKTSLRQQILALTKFRNGQFNCMFATSVAEEGLDIPDCSLIIRFDLCQTMIQYVQSRGRARRQNSTFIHMLEDQNSNHSKLYSSNKEAELRMQQFCRGLDADQFLHDTEDDKITDADALKGETYIEQSTGARMNYTTCLAILGHFVATLPNPEDEPLQPVFAVFGASGNFKCEVTLPACSPLPCATGRECRRKKFARASAAFRACVLLREKGYLDEHMLPSYRKLLPVMRNAALAENMNKRGNYEMKLKPSCWETGRGTTPQSLFMLMVDMPQGLDRAHQPLWILTRHCLQDFPAFPVHLDSGRVSIINTSSSKVEIAVDASAIEKLTRFTLLVFKDIFRKTYKHDSSSMSYYLAPSTSSSSKHATIDWPAIDFACTEEPIRWFPGMDPSLLTDRLMFDSWTGGNRCFTERIATEYKAFDPVPEGAITLQDRKKFNTDIVNSSSAMFGRSRLDKVWNNEQPVLETTRISYRVNLLAAPESKEVGRITKCFVCPEPLYISRISAAFATTCLIFPAIIHRIDEYLIGIEACVMLNLNIETSMALEAFTKDSNHTDGDDDQDLDAIQFQRGMGRNYERLEFLGDTFLKMATTIAVFVRHPDHDEFESHVNRMLMLCNKNLSQVAKTKQLYEYIRTKSFSRRTWYPEGLELLEGKTTHKTGTTPTHTVAEKTIADVCEAVMGAAFVTHHDTNNWTPEQWHDAVHAVTELVGSEEHPMRQWLDYSKAYVKPKYQTTVSSAPQRDTARQIEKQHPYRFRYPGLLRSALIHPSQPSEWEKVPSYQRLEFLGDALLDMVFVTHLFYNYPDKDPQWLTEHKMAMVSNRFLGAVCIKMGLHRHLRHNSSNLQRQIGDFETELLEAEHSMGGSVDYWTSVKEAPKCLADVVEAFVGAVFIDSDFDYSQVQMIFDMHMRHFFQDMRIYDRFAKDHPMIGLHSLMEQTFGCREFRLMTKELPNGDGTSEIMAGVLIHKTVIGGNVGRSERYTKIRAAHEAREELLGLAPHCFRRDYGCDCRAECNDEGDGVVMEGT